MNADSLPLIKDLLGMAAEGNIFIKLDWRDVYLRVCVKEKEKWKSTFNTLLGQFEYLVMPFGLQGASGIFMALINVGLIVHLADS